LISSGAHETTGFFVFPQFGLKGERLWRTIFSGRGPRQPWGPERPPNIKPEGGPDLVAGFAFCTSRVPKPALGVLSVEFFFFFFGGGGGLQPSGRGYEHEGVVVFAPLFSRKKKKTRFRPPAVLCARRVGRVVCEKTQGPVTDARFFFFSHGGFYSGHCFSITERRSVLDIRRGGGAGQPAACSATRNRWDFYFFGLFFFFFHFPRVGFFGGRFHEKPKLLGAVARRRGGGAPRAPGFTGAVRRFAFSGIFRQSSETADFAVSIGDFAPPPQCERARPGFFCRLVWHIEKGASLTRRNLRPPGGGRPIDDNSAYPAGNDRRE